jgi:hypothetical protein
MKKIILTVALFCNTIALTQQLKSIKGFDKIDKDSYFKRCTTEEEAIRSHSLMLDFNNLDTTFTKYDRDNNPVVFSYFKLNQSSDKIVATFIFPHDSYFDVWFMEVEDQDTHFIDVIDKNGDLIELIYEKPKD